MNLKEYYSKVGKASPEGLCAAIEKAYAKENDGASYVAVVKKAVSEGANDLGATSSSTVDGAFRTAHLLSELGLIVEDENAIRDVVRALVVGRCPNASGQAAWLGLKATAAELADA